MSLFKDASDSGDIFDKILLWGPQHAGKTHTAMTWPEPVFVDREGGRALHFRDRFAFRHFAPSSLQELADAFKELHSPNAPGKTFVIESASAIYLDLVQEHTALSERGSYVTDWVTVNRRFLACINFVFGTSNRNVIFTAHQTAKLVRDGRNFRNNGVNFVGDERFRFAFDYIFRIEPKGDPRESPALYHVEKSASPNLKIGDVVRGLDYAKFRELTEPKTVPTVAADDGDPIGPDEIGAIEDCARKSGVGQMRVADLAKIVSHRTSMLAMLTKGEGRKVYALLLREPKRSVA